MKQTMKSCILEQPDTIRRVCQNAEKVCDSVYSIAGKGPFDKIYLIGSGTSLHTAIAAKYAFTKWFNAEVQVFTPFDFLYYYPHYRLDEKTLILGISQTARSIGTIHCLEKGREYGARTVMVTAEPDNPGGKSAEAILDTCTGEELVGAKTKGFTSTIAMLYLYAAGLAGKELDISLVPKWMEQSLRCTSEEIEDFAEEYKSAPYESYKDMKADAEKFFDEKGITYYQPTDEELNQWKEYAASLSDKWRELIGEELYNQVSELFNY